MLSIILVSPLILLACTFIEGNIFHGVLATVIILFVWWCLNG